MSNQAPKRQEFIPPFFFVSHSQLYAESVNSVMQLPSPRLLIGFLFHVIFKLLTGWRGFYNIVLSMQVTFATLSSLMLQAHWYSIASFQSSSISNILFLNIDFVKRILLFKPAFFFFITESLIYFRV